MRGLSLVAASGGRSSSRCAGHSLSRPLLLWSTGSRRAGSVVVAHRPSSSKACGIFPDQGSNPCPLHWQADSQPLRHQGSPKQALLKININKFLWDKVYILLLQIKSTFNIELRERHNRHIRKGKWRRKQMHRDTQRNRYHLNSILCICCDLWKALSLSQALSLFKRDVHDVRKILKTD